MSSYRGGDTRNALHRANPVPRKDGLGRTVWKCADCTRGIHKRKGGRGTNPGVMVWVHSARTIRSRHRG